ncbi:MAG: heme lyase CcmF/NrfE family subunit, partial [Solirubrobacterales bacterium]|nr:heme lyase CcmF/NrfE family subunit [Solirubrobacterales bacterium]
MLTLGRACLILALAVSVYGVGASLYGARKGNRAWVASGRRAVYAVAGSLLVAFAVLEAAFLRSDFSFELVAGHSSTTTPLFYRFTAMWSSQEGSLLLWATLLGLWSSLILFLTRNKLREVAPYAAAVLLGFAAFFVSLMVFLETPFARTLGALPAEGVGLNPLLRHPSMMIHPPMLYSGYTLFTIPFAFAIGALVTRRLGAEWIRSTRPFTLAAWLFLGIGVLLGSRWSYTELGWGGYWAWDPVENASLMPWLTGTAFLHSVMLQEKRGMLKVWNVSLVLATGVLAILGTFLVRSGILDSIHAFGASTLGVPFLVLIGVLVAGSVALVVSRSRDLRSEHRLDSVFSRESAFLLNNLVLVGICFVVFWGTFFPLISEAVSGSKASVGPPWFNRYITPLALILVLLSGIGPAIAWRRATLANLRRTMLGPALFAVAVLVALLVGAGVTDKPLALAMFVFAAFVTGTVFQELWRGVKARRAMSDDSMPMAVVSLIRRNRRRYGGYIVHLGIALLFTGIAASSAFQQARDVDLRPGQSARIGSYDVTYVKPTGDVVAASNGRLERIDLGAVLKVTRDGEALATMRSRRSFFPSQAPEFGPISRFFEGDATSEVALDAGVREDVWTVVSPDVRGLLPSVKEGDRVFAAAREGGKLSRAEMDVLLVQALRGLAASYASDPPAATFRLIVSPLVTWIWL